MDGLIMTNEKAEKRPRVSRPKVTRKKKTIAPALHKCEYCTKTFVNETSLIDHTCEKKLRWLRQDDRDVQIAFRAYQQFYKSVYKTKNDKTMKEFVTSQHYTYFHNFGKFVIEMNINNAIDYVKWLIRGDAKVINWCSMNLYQLWLRYQNENEQPFAAGERSILLMEQWARDHDDDWRNFFRNVSPSLATHMIKSGRLSPWVLYAVGQDLFDRMSEEQFGIIEIWIDPKKWHSKISKDYEEFEELKEMLNGHLQTT